MKLENIFDKKSKWRKVSGCQIEKFIRYRLRFTVKMSREL